MALWRRNLQKDATNTHGTTKALTLITHHGDGIALGNGHDLNREPFFVVCVDMVVQKKFVS